MRNIITFFVMLFSFCLVAQENGRKLHPIDASYQKCLNKPDNQHTHGMVNCAVEAKKAWDAEMNQYYQLLQEQLSSEQKMKLKATQETWKNYKVKEFIFSADLHFEMGGTKWKIVAADNETEIIKQRALQLKSYYETFTEGNP